FRYPQLAVSRQRERPRPGAVFRDVADHLDGNFSSAGSSSQQNLGLQEEPVLPDEPGGLARTGLGMRLPGNAFDRPDGAEPEDAGAGDWRPEFRLRGTGIHRDESFGDFGYDWNLLPDLLGTAVRQGPGASGAAGGDHHRLGVGSGEGHL